MIYKHDASLCEGLLALRAAPTCVCTRVCARTYACVRMCAYVRVCVCMCVCVRARTCERALCTCVCVYGCVHTCVRALCTCACVCMCVRVCVCVRIRVYVRVYTCTHLYTCPIHVCVCVRVRLRACACEGIEPLGVLSPQERVSLPTCLSTLGGLRGDLGGFPGLSPFLLIVNLLTPIQALRGPCILVI